MSDDPKRWKAATRIRNYARMIYSIGGPFEVLGKDRLDPAGVQMDDDSKEKPSAIKFVAPLFPRRIDDFQVIDRVQTPDGDAYVTYNDIVKPPLVIGIMCSLVEVLCSMDVEAINALMFKPARFKIREVMCTRISSGQIMGY